VPFRPEGGVYPKRKGQRGYRHPRIGSRAAVLQFTVLVPPVQQALSDQLAVLRRPCLGHIFGYELPERFITERIW